MKWVLVGLVGTLTLAGCMTPPVPAAPQTGLEAAVVKVVMDDAFTVATAEQLASDCPRLAVNPGVRQQYVNNTAKKVIDLYGGDAARAARAVDGMNRRLRSGDDAEARQRVLAYLQDNDYVPGDADAACRTGDKERRNGSAIGKVLSSK